MTTSARSRWRGSCRGGGCGTRSRSTRSGAGRRSDSGTGNSDHREFELAGLRGVKLGSLDNPCRHIACDTPDRLQRDSFEQVQRVVEAVLRR